MGRVADPPRGSETWALHLLAFKGEGEGKDRRQRPGQRLVARRLLGLGWLQVGASS